MKIWSIFESWFHLYFSLDIKHIKIRLQPILFNLLNTIQNFIGRSKQEPAHCFYSHSSEFTLLLSPQALYLNDHSSRIPLFSLPNKQNSSQILSAISSDMNFSLTCVHALIKSQHPQKSNKSTDWRSLLQSLSTIASLIHPEQDSTVVRIT